VPARRIASFEKHWTPERVEFFAAKARAKCLMEQENVRGDRV
jgi:hypothetical protein